MLAGTHSTFVEHDLDDGVITLGKYIVRRPDLADSTCGIPTHLSISEKFKEFVDK